MSAVSFLVSFSDIPDASGQSANISAEFPELRECLHRRSEVVNELAPFQALAVSPAIALHAGELTLVFILLFGVCSSQLFFLCCVVHEFSSRPFFLGIQWAHSLVFCS
jgi:hypothetical protein